MPKYSVGEFVVNGRDICKVVAVVSEFRDQGDYYKLQSVEDESLVVYSPVDKQDNLLRPVISKQEAEALIDRLTEIEPVAVDTRSVDTVYENLAKSGKHEDIIRLVKTAYQRCEERKKRGVPKPEKDKLYFRLAEKLLYSEFSIALGKSYDETKDYIANRAQSATGSAE